MVNKRRVHFMWQPALAFLFVVAVLLGLNEFRSPDLIWALGAGALSSTAYIVFALPSSRAAQPKNIVVGYCVAIGCGVLVRLLVGHYRYSSLDHLHAALPYSAILFSAVVVVLVIVVMSLLRCQHPPAAGLSLLLVIDMKSFTALLFIGASAVALALIKLVLRRHLKDLA